MSMAGASQRQRVRFISPRKESFDAHIQRLVEKAGYGVPATYYGIEDAARADEVRRGLRRAGKRLGVAVKAFTAANLGCQRHPDCQYHVLYTCYSLEDARRFMEAKRRAAEALMRQSDPG